MEIYCLFLFKDEYDKISGKNSYKNLSEELFNYFNGKELSDILSGTRLNNSENDPYIKKRLDGKGGFRLYYLVKKDKKRVYLMFVHPKTGSLGSDNILPEAKARIYKLVLEAIISNQLYRVVLDKKKITFESL